MFSSPTFRPTPLFAPAGVAGYFDCCGEYATKQEDGSCYDLLTKTTFHSSACDPPDETGAGSPEGSSHPSSPVIGGGSDTHESGGSSGSWQTPGPEKPWGTTDLDGTYDGYIDEEGALHICEREGGPFLGYDPSRPGGCVYSAARDSHVSSSTWGGSGGAPSAPPYIFTGDHAESTHLDPTTNEAPSSGTDQGSSSKSTSSAWPWVLGAAALVTVGVLATRPASAG